MIGLMKNGKSRKDRIGRRVYAKCSQLGKLGEGAPFLWVEKRHLSYEGFMTGFRGRSESLFCTWQLEILNMPRCHILVACSEPHHCHGNNCHLHWIFIHIISFNIQPRTEQGCLSLFHLGGNGCCNKPSDRICLCIGRASTHHHSIHPQDQPASLSWDSSGISGLWHARNHW